ncbi:MAG: preprotein translocase subunit SecA [Pseudomonadales bacterium]|nr:preprotein translocase subunit SecA [Pseudomonadales bacterium]
MFGLAKRLIGTKNDRELKRMGKIVKNINTFEEPISSLSDEALKEKTVEFRSRLEQGATLEDVLPEAFACVRESGKRFMNMRHFDTQMLGGITLHEGRIAEMRTGEGKTLVATLPAYLNALSGKGVHLVTVNEYLATRDANWMSPIYEGLGLTVDVIVPGQEPETKKAAYQADVVYGTNNEFGFDYLRDNMAFRVEDKSQRELNFAVVDEVDSILIDEARTPLIISGAAEDSSELYKKVDGFISHLTRQEEADEGVEVTPGHYVVDEKQRQVELTEDGHEVIEGLMIENQLLEEGDSLYAPTNLRLLHHVHSALRSYVLFQKNVDYIVRDGEVLLVDEHTGRTMPGRRLSEGLHQALEAKEGVAIQNESQTLASTTFQNYFRLYNNLSGMTGTADTEAFEFHQIYGLDVVVIPTNKPMVRKDQNDLIFMTTSEKYEAIVDHIRQCQESSQPVLVGTASVESSELISKFLDEKKVKHNVLNAKFHEKEADIIAEAGRPGAITIATNMAGRGTDIVLGGNVEVEISKLKNPSESEIETRRTEWEERHKQVLEAGGLYIIGTERHESRRIDNQLRGRSGRQGDAGESRFYLSLEDNLMRIFASDRMRGFMQKLGMEQGEAIEHKMVSSAIEKAQRKVEGRNFDIRKQLLEYDDVANDQRQIIYKQRNDLMEQDDISETIELIRSDVLHEVIDDYIPPQSIEEQWDVPGLEKQLETEFDLELPLAKWLEEDSSLHEVTLREKVLEQLIAVYEEKSQLVGDEIRTLEKQVMLQVLDTLWKEHLASMDHLRQGIHLRAYAQKNPKQEYKRESFELFESMLSNLKHEVVRFLSKVQIKLDDVDEMERKRLEMQAEAQMAFEHAETSAIAQAQQPSPADNGNRESITPGDQPFVRTGKKVGRNEPCPCGSGKKYKQCHGKLE